MCTFNLCVRSFVDFLLNTIHVAPAVDANNVMDMRVQHESAPF